MSDPREPRETPVDRSLVHFGFLDTVRAIAILMVLAVHTLYHYEELNRGHLSARLISLGEAGQFGVQLFFLASAVTLAFSHEQRSQESHSVQKFFLRRFFRIAPLYWLGVAIYSVAFLIHGTFPGFVAVIANVLFIHPYIPATFNCLPQGGWSVGVEMQFYVLLPLILRFVTNLRSSLWFLGLSIIECLASYFAFTARGVLSEYRDFTFFWLPNQLPIFALGLTVYFVMKPSILDRDKNKRPFDALWLWLGIISAVLVAELRKLTPLDHLLMALPLALLVVGLCKNPMKLLVNKTMSLVGTVSFSMYIFHWLVLDLVFAIFKRTHPHFSSNLELIGLYVVVCVLTVPCAFLSYQLIERPGMSLGKAVIKRLLPAK